MTTPDKLSRERLEYLRMRPDVRRGDEWDIYAAPQEEQSMATEILELREEVERLRAKVPPVTALPQERVSWDQAAALPPTALLLQDPELAGLRVRVEATEAGLAYVRGRLNI